MKTKHLFFIFLLIGSTTMNVKAADLFVEAESFKQKGGWVIDQQFMDQMGSPYLLAHGLGVRVADAITEVTFPQRGTYEVYVRTFNWTSPWTNKPGPGKFQISINSSKLSTVLGDSGNKWFWQKAGQITIDNTKASIAIHDLTGFDGRVDAIYFTTHVSSTPPEDIDELASFRNKKLGIKPSDAPKYDLVVVGGGIGGMCTAVSAARQGMKVALIHNRPILGGNNSSEVRVHLGAHVNIGKYPALGNMIREFGHSREGNAKPADYYEDEKKQAFIEDEKNVTLYANYHAFRVKMKDEKVIKSVTAKNIETGQELIFEAPLFVDCTGDGTIGVLAGADYTSGCESFETYQEPRAPKNFEQRTMGSSVQWYSKDKKHQTIFPDFEYGVVFNDKNCELVEMGEWTWETGMMYNQVEQFERIRDYGLLVVYSNWAYLKNQLKDNEKFRNRSLDWVAYIGGKRESRRLLGDLVLTENDLINWVEYPDGTCAATWTIDLHYPDPNNTKNFPNEEFKSIAIHNEIYPYPIPYRCFYSRNVDNLFMVGRNISVSHVALGTTRLMRTIGMMGEVVGMAASICKDHNVMPRAIYQDYFSELDKMMQKGAGKTDVPDNQKFNVMKMLKEKPGK